MTGDGIVPLDLAFMDDPAPGDNPGRDLSVLLDQVHSSPVGDSHPLLACYVLVHASHPSTLPCRKRKSRPSSNDRDLWSSLSGRRDLFRDIHPRYSSKDH